MCLVMIESANRIVLEVSVAQINNCKLQLDLSLVYCISGDDPEVSKDLGG